MSLKRIFILFIAIALLAAGLIYSFVENKKKPSNISKATPVTFAVASYNVENLFDDRADGTEYEEFVPNMRGWNSKTFQTKVKNISKVLKELNADIVALEEVENENALKALLAELKKEGAEYPYYRVSHNSGAAIQIALISKFEILSAEEHSVKFMTKERPVLKAVVAVGDKKLTVFANHWKAKPAPESTRLPYAKLLRELIDKTASGEEFIALGDFNCNYDEMNTFLNDPKLNDTNNLTGINHILKTAVSKPGEAPKFADEVTVASQKGNEYLYNLWLELQKNERMSEYFRSDKNTPDNIIIPKAMFDSRGISYVDKSFAVFRPPYLLKGGRPYRFSFSEKKGPFRIDSDGEGYSDHLPVYAKFSTQPFALASQAAAKPQPPQPSPVPTAAAQNKKAKSDPAEQKIAAIYEKNLSGDVDFIVKKAVVVYKHFDNVVVKEPNGRAVYVYAAGKDMELGGVYSLRITKLEDYNGLKEVKAVFDAKKIGAENPKKYCLSDENLDFSDPKYQNEIVCGIDGWYSKGRFRYGDGKEVKMYVRDKNLKPKGMMKLRLNAVHIGNFHEPQLIVYQKSDFEQLQ